MQLSTEVQIQADNLAPIYNCAVVSKGLWWLVFWHSAANKRFEQNTGATRYIWAAVLYYALDIWWHNTFENQFQLMFINSIYL